MSFNKILIANRGEIAVRVIHTAKIMGYRTVAVYSEADTNALHVQLADQAVCIGPAPVNQSYLVINNIINAAQQTDADAIHPGYGFLSENAEFAKTCMDNNIAFIGPPADAIELMGNKRQAKIAMLKADVPCVPGYEGDDQSDEALMSAAKNIGFPIMIKAAAGGGGRGMRLTHSEADFYDQLHSARSEAENAFGSGEIILEKAIIEPRHIEIQIFADQQGNTIYLGERDCSIQRRHQKVVEEAPSPFVDNKLREEMGEAAVAAAKACQYVGAGTVEFLVDKDKQFYFLEMNTRLQVEHPVTELVTKTDLVQWQLQIAAGETLPMSQSDVSIKGHAIEVRLYAENPSENFLPQTGDVLFWKPSKNHSIRIDHGIQVSQPISPYYDPMLAKIIAYGDNREQARYRLINAIEDTQLLGTNTNKQFLTDVLTNNEFTQGTNVTTAFIEQFLNDAASLNQCFPSQKEISLAGALLHAHSGQKATHQSHFINWTNAHPIPAMYALGFHEQTINLQITGNNTDKGIQFNVCNEDNIDTIEIIRLEKNHCIYLYNNIREKLYYSLNDNTLYLDSKQGNRQFINITHKPAENTDALGNGKIKAPMDGAIIDVMVKDGEKIAKNQILLVLEAMKIEHQIKADMDGYIKSIEIKRGDQVKTRQLLVEITEED